jgi:hypothetical protein
MRIPAVAFASVLAVWLAQACTPTCNSDEDCGDGKACVQNPLKADESTCTFQCAADVPCPTGFACVAHDGELKGACLQATGNKQLGDACGEDVDCGSGACAKSGDTPICVTPCNADGTCPTDGDRCILEDLRHVCTAPLDDKASGETCTDPRECLTGTCVLRPGDEDAKCADPCTDTCDGDLVCARLDGGGRACIEALDDGARCTGAGMCEGGFCIEDVDGVAKCASLCGDGGECDEGFSCTRDDEGNDICMPLVDDRASGEECTSARQCASGHCASFADFGVLCADPCVDAQCAEGLVCWTHDPETDPDGTDVCGPTP